MRFSKRTAWELEENALTARLRERRARGEEVLDLTASNPTACGFVYEPEVLLSPLAVPAALEYEPQPFGLERARAAVAQYYRDHGADVPVERICLTTSTSEAYSYLFRLLCDPGDEVLIARPSYPLFDFIARLDSIVLREYPLRYDPGASADSEHAWTIDFDALRGAINERTRAIATIDQPTLQALEEVRGHRERVCPLACEAGTELRGTKCVATPKALDRTRHAARPPEHDRSQRSQRSVEPAHTDAPHSGSYANVPITPQSQNRNGESWIYVGKQRCKTYEPPGSAPRIICP